MLAEIQRLRNSLGMSYGELLRLAREVSHDASLFSIHQLRSSQRRLLVLELYRAAATSNTVALERVA